MSTIQQSQHPDIIFKGIDGDECEAFVAALEDLAYSEGWTEDRRRMLFFARSRLRNAALRWFVRLDPSVKSDWDLFVQALFDQYPPVSNPPNSNEVGMITPIWSATTVSPALSSATLPANRSIPSAEENLQQQETEQGLSGSSHLLNQIISRSSDNAPISSFRLYQPSQLGVHFGRLRVVYEHGSPPAYVWQGSPEGRIKSKTTELASTYYGFSDPPKCVTLDRQEALVVSFRIDAEPHPIACLDTSQYQGDLAVLLAGAVDCEFHPLVATHGVRAASDVTFSGGSIRPYIQVVSKIWNVLADGTLQATLSDFPEPLTRDEWGSPYGQVKPSNWTTTTVYVDPTGVPISFAKDYATPNSLHPNSNRPLLKARIVFEPL